MLFVCSFFHIITALVIVVDSVGYDWNQLIHVVRTFLRILTMLDTAVYSVDW